MSLITILAGGALALLVGQTVSASAEIPLPWYAQVLITLAGAAGTALIGLAARALGKLFDYLAAKTRIAKLAEVDELIMGYVSETYQAEVKQLKAAAEDGKLSPEEVERLQRIPIEKLKEQLGVGQLAKLLGDGFEAYLKSRVERAVIAHKVAAAKPDPR
jgi:hypothetical protein